MDAFSVFYWLGVTSMAVIWWFEYFKTPGKKDFWTSAAIIVQILFWPFVFMLVLCLTVWRVISESERRRRVEELQTEGKDTEE